MSRVKRGAVRVALTTATVSGLVVTGLSGAQAAPLQTDSGSTTPTIHVAMTDKAMYVDGALSIPAGRLKITLENAKAKHDGSIEVAQLHAGYTWKNFRSDISNTGRYLFGPHPDKKKGLKYLQHAVANFTGFGGLDANSGKTTRGTLLLTQPGSYVLFNDSGNVPRDPRKLTVGSASGPQTLWAGDAQVVAHTNRRFTGDTVLPAHGTIHFTNESTESPHFMGLIHVKEGTTRKQAINAFSGSGSGDIFLPGGASTDVLTHGNSMNLQTHTAPGEYAMACFFLDPQTGMPHALMGMVRIVHLK